MGKTNYKGLRVDYQPGQKVKVMLGRDWFDAEVVKSNKKTVVVRTLFSKTKYRTVSIRPEDIAGAGQAGILAAAVAAASRVPGDHSLGTTLEPYTVSGTRVVKLPRIRVKPMEEVEAMLDYEAATDLEGEELERQVGIKEAHKENYGPEPKAETKPETAADVLAELEKMLE